MNVEQSQEGNRGRGRGQGCRGRVGGRSRRPAAHDMHSSLRYKDLPKPDNSFAEHFEFNATPFFDDSMTGMFFRDIFISNKWHHLWGSDEWWLRPQFYQDFKSNLRYENGLVIWDDTVSGKSVPLDAQFLSSITGVPVNPNFEFKEILACFEAKLDDYLDKIAPYRNKTVNGHFISRDNALSTNGLQENCVLIAKWFTIFVDGVNTKHLVRGSCAWFLYHLMYNCLPRGFCLMNYLAFALRSARSRGRHPFPYLVSRIVSTVRGVQMTMEDYPMRPTVASRLLHSDVPGFWDGTVIPQNSNSFPTCCYTDQEWVNWSHRAGVVNPGGGKSFSVQWSLTLGDPTAAFSGAFTGTAGASSSAPSQSHQEETTSTDPSHDIPSGSAPFTGYSTTQVPPYRGVGYMTWEQFGTAGMGAQIPSRDGCSVLLDSLALINARLTCLHPGEDRSAYVPYGFDFTQRAAYHAEFDARGAGVASGAPQADAGVASGGVAFGAPPADVGVGTCDMDEGGDTDVWTLDDGQDNGDQD